MTGVLIVTYNSEEVIGACLDSCAALGHADVLVVDNASTDGTRAEVLTRPWVRTIFNATNRGFAGAVNQGIAALGADYVLLLNPDTVLNSSIAPLEESFADPRTGAVAGRLVDASGYDQAKFHLRRLPTPAALAFEALGLNSAWPGNPANRRYRPAAAERDFEQPAAAFLVIRRTAWEAVGGFDESFHPVWFEDVDFCKRLSENNWTIQYVPEVVAMHIGGHSASKITWGARQLFWYGSLLRYASKHYTAWSRSIVCAGVMLACCPRMVAGIFVTRSLTPVTVYSKVAWLAGRCLVFGHVDTSRRQSRARQQVVGG